MKMPPVKKKATKKKSIARKTTAKKHPRDNINAEAIITALEKHVMGEQEMSATQVSAALALLKKTIPDIVDPARKGVVDAVQNMATSHEDALGALE